LWKYKLRFSWFAYHFQNFSSQNAAFGSLSFLYLFFGSSFNSAWTSSLAFLLAFSISLIWVSLTSFVFGGIYGGFIYLSINLSQSKFANHWWAFNAAKLPPILISGILFMSYSMSLLASLSLINAGYFKVLFKICS